MFPYFCEDTLAVNIVYVINICKKVLNTLFISSWLLDILAYLISIYLRRTRYKI